MAVQHRWVVAVVLVLSACVESALPQQGDVICIAGQRVVGDRCGSEEEIAVCALQAQGARCATSTIGTGWCDAGICYPIVCGNGIVEPGEVCDDSNTHDNDGCKADCLSKEVCGDGVVNRGDGESCDDGNQLGGDGCQGNCQFAFCGDGIVDATEACDVGAANSNEPSLAGNRLCRTNCQWSTCGDKVRDADEVCDDGNRDEYVSLDGAIEFDHCSANCKSEQTCGNGIIDLHPDAARSEECDPQDAVFGVSHDGCSSTCRREIADWTEQRVGQPSPRAHTAMAYDSQRGKLVVFSGLSDDYGAETWEWDNDIAHWELRRPVHSPPPRNGHRLVFDEARQVTVMFGGYSATTWPNSDTWEWNGIDWVQRFTAHAPSPRYHFGMSYDSQRQRTVLFGGATPNVANDVWEYDGVDWQLVIPLSAALPAPRYAHGQAYDSHRQRTLVFGGVADTVNNELWQWDGAARTWSRVPAQVDDPIARYYPAMTFDAAAGNVVMFGGAGGLNDTWLWNGIEWQTASLIRSPTGRHGAALAYDSRQYGLLLFGGFSDRAHGDLWRLHQGNPGTWLLQASADVPTQRVYQQAAYSPSNRELIMFGGAGAGADTWRWQAATGWAKSADGGFGFAPNNRLAAMMIYESKRDRYLMFGGLNVANTGYLDDMWSLQNGGWSELPLSQRPSARNSVGAYYDSKRDRVVMFGGVGQFGLLGDTWEFDCQTNQWEQVTTQGSPPASYGGVTVYDQHRNRGVLVVGYDTSTWLYEVSDTENRWTQHAGATPSPPRRRYAAAIYHPLRKSVVLIGGEDGRWLSDMWEFQHDTWRELSTASSPPARSSASAAFDVESSSMIVFGGRNVGYLNDTWSLRWSASPTSQACPAGDAAASVDTDGDSLDSDSDPDCWWRRTPDCPPGTTCQ